MKRVWVFKHDGMSKLWFFTSQGAAARARNSYIFFGDKVGPIIRGKFVPDTARPPQPRGGNGKKKGAKKK